MLNLSVTSTRLTSKLLLTKNIFNDDKLVPLEKAELFFCISDKLLFYLQIKKTRENVYAKS